jgi:hypothetical protein
MDASDAPFHIIAGLGFRSFEWIGAQIEQCERAKHKKWLHPHLEVVRLLFEELGTIVPPLPSCSRCAQEVTAKTDEVYLNATAAMVVQRFFLGGHEKPASNKRRVGSN